jgi:hypothetical protein
MLSNLDSAFLNLAFISLSSASESFFVLKGGNGDFLHSSIKLFGFIVRWLIAENGVSSENDGFNKGLETWVVDVILDNDLLIWLSEFLVPEMSLVVDGAVNGLSVEEHVGDGHSVLGKGTCLVGADARGGSEGLDGLQVLDEHHLSSHSLGGKSEGYSDGSKKSFWYVSDNNTNGENQVGDNIVVVDETEDEENDTKGHGDSRDDQDESMDLNGKWGLGRLSRGSKVSNLTDDGVVTNSEADTATFTSSAGSSEESNVLGLEDVLDWCKIWVDEDILRLSGKGSVVDFHLVGLENADIARDVLTTFDDNNISWDDLFGINGLLFSVSDNGSSWWNEVLELSHHFSGFGSLGI